MRVAFFGGRSSQPATNPLHEAAELSAGEAVVVGRQETRASRIVQGEGGALGGRSRSTRPTEPLSRPAPRTADERRQAARGRSAHSYTGTRARRRRPFPPGLGPQRGTRRLESFQGGGGSALDFQATYPTLSRRGAERGDSGSRSNSTEPTEPLSRLAPSTRGGEPAAHGKPRR